MRSVEMAASATPVIPGYQISSQLYAGSKTQVYRAIREKENLPVVIKLLTSESPNFNELLQFRNQYTISKNLNIPGIIRPLGLEAYNNGYILVMEDAGEISLKEYVENTPLSLVDFLAIAIQLTQILQDLHQNRVIHKDIKPVNILIQPQTKKVRLIDFSIASLLPKETQEIKSPNILEGTLAYISPEQTGRMNRGIDYRSDFYSLGVTFYELLTGELPFISADPMELVHCHLAKMPTAIGNNKEIPQIISDIVLKLMAKNAEDRYQSALGLRYDLETCLAQLQDTGEIRNFAIGKRDTCDRFLIPEKLYGRESEVSILLQAFERVTNGSSEMMLVAGFSGIGKTAVVNEIHKSITRQQGYFIKGKFDQFNRNIPLSAFVQAFRDLMGHLLSETEAQLQTWKTKILATLGDNGQVLIEVIPELELIIGKQPTVPEVSGNAAQNRFNLLFSNFIAVFTSKAHPLVIFLDDLQWSDSASLQLINLLMQDNSYLLLLGAYRDNEVSPTHPFMLMVDELKKAQKTLNTIILSPLAFGDMNQLVADTLHCTTERSHPLTELITRKTQGNPFFITQFLKALHETGKIIFNRQQGYWECDIAQINTLSLTDDVVEFMATQLQKLPSETQEVLKLAACIGNSFDLTTLAIIYQQSPDNTATALWKALQEGLILPHSQMYKFYLNYDVAEKNIGNIEKVVYRFLHDRVQQAAYSLIPESQKQATHLNIGQLLLSNLAVPELENRIFDIVNQLNIGIALIQDIHQKEQLAQLNLQAGNKAKAATAYSASVSYLNTGVALLNPDSWQSQYELTLKLYESLAEAEYLNTNFAKSKYLIDQTLLSARHSLDKIKVYEIQIQSYTSQNQLLDAIDTGREALNLLGIDFPEQCDVETMNNQHQKLKIILGDRPIATLADLPLLNELYQSAAMRILAGLFASVYLAKPELLPLKIFTMVKICIQYGNSPQAAIAYSFYGLFLCATGEIARGYEFGKLATIVLEKLQAKELTSKVNFTFALFIKHWQDSIRSVLPVFLSGLTSGLEHGDLEYVGYCANSYCQFLFWTGENLEITEAEADKYCKLVQEIKQEASVIWVNTWRQTVNNLRGKAENPTMLIGSSFNELVTLPSLIQSCNVCGICYVYLAKLLLLYLFNEPKRAEEYANKFEEYEQGVAGLLVLPLKNFYQSLSLLSLYSSPDAEIKTVDFDKVINNQQLLKKWAEHAPMNYLHKFHLVEAEIHRVLGKHYEAIEYYDRAISQAQAHGYIQEEALANELTAKFYLNWGKVKLAQVYMEQAYHCYALWGAAAKITHLEQQYPQLLAAIIKPTKQGLNSEASITQYISSKTTGKDFWLDLPAVMKAAQAISQEIELEKLLATLMQIAIANAGAQVGYLFLLQNEQLVVVAKANTEQVTTLEVPLEESQNIPQSLIYAVARTQQTTVFENLSDSLQFAKDKYIITHQPKSVLCTPISRQGKLIGILYLENNLTIGAFTSDRIEILQLLTSQAAISVENARLYQQAENYAYTLEVEVERQTQALKQKAEDLEQTLTQLQQTQAQLIHSEKMSSLGQMVAGIAHEINNPVTFIQGNLNHTKNYIQDMMRLLNLYQQEYPQPNSAIQAMETEIELDFLLADANQTLESMKAGSDRISQIVLSLRNFSRLDEAEIKAVDLHSGIESTLLLVQHRLQKSANSPEIQVIKNYGNLPLVTCYPSQLNQVFLNIINNAIDAIRAHPQNSEQPQIRIFTEVIENAKLKIAIANTHSFIPESLHNRIFEPFFTTKSVGQGKGLGLSVSYSIIQQHKGTLTVRSQPNTETEFEIVLPIT
ncbi:ATP-binding sensor histidine kinase [Nostoc sp. FACHB-190]|uniref:trifunctional serine/threonine-protein kinase/ATP-binding protein/sensor histidine kinase n=1 Tax=Nostoc sp. FACHB-190 TaxID=2692838 RepID=UPI00168331B4|nr:ATP-binding sensor histidine kinase [Nostoc sp. FACHB-190]MBD2302910.1 AAA family ATPase [Nostoc sp. FACHB-190]